MLLIWNANEREESERKEGKGEARLPQCYGTVYEL